MSEDQKRRTCVELGSGADAVTARFQLNLALAAGAFSKSVTTRTIVLDEGHAPEILFQQASAKHIEVGRSDRGDETSTDLRQWISAVDAIPGVPAPSSIIKTAVSKGLQFEAPPDALGERDWQSDSFSYEEPNRYYRYLTDLSSTSPDAKSARHDLVSNGSITLDNVVFRFHNGRSEYVQLLDKLPLPPLHSPLNWDGDGEMTEDEVRQIKFNAAISFHRHAGWSVGEAGEMISDPSCSFEPPVVAEARKTVSALLADLSLKTDKVSVKEANAARTKIMAGDDYKAAKALADWKCSVRTPHFHAPQDVSSSTSVPVWMRLVAWHATSTFVKDGWVPANLVMQMRGDREVHHIVSRDDPSQGDDEEFVHAERKPLSDQDQQTALRPYCYVKDVLISTWKLRRVDHSKMIVPREALTPLGILDLRDFLGGALANATFTLERLVKERDAEQGASSKLKTLNLLAEGVKADRDQQIATLEPRIKSYDYVLDLVDRVLQNAGKNKPRMPVTVGGKPRVAVQVSLPTDGSLDGTFRTHLQWARANKVDLARCTRLAPLAALAPDQSRPAPMPQDVVARLLEARAVPRTGAKSKALPTDFAWRDTIVAYNASMKYHGGKMVELDRRFQPRTPHTPAKGKGPAAAPVPAHDGALMSTMSEMMLALAEGLKEMKEAVKPPPSVPVASTSEKPMVSLPADAEERIQRLEALLARSDERLAAALEQRATPQVPDGKTEDLLPPPSDGGWPDEDDRSSDSHVTVEGHKWVKFEPSNLHSGGVYLIVRSVHDGKLYVAPKRAEVPPPVALEGEGLMTFQRKKSKALEDALKRKPPSPPIGAPAKVEPIVEIDSPAVSSAKKKQRKAKAAELKSADAPEKKEPPAYKCSDCNVPHGFKHEDTCPKKAVPWGKLSKEGKAQRKKDLAGVAEEKPVKGGTKAKDDLEKQDPLKATRVPLTDKEEKQLRKHFALKPPCEPAELEALLPMERKAKLRESEIPRWARAASEITRENLKAILSGSLTLELFQAGQYIRPVGKQSAKQVSAAWTALKAKHEGVPLVEKPKTVKEKKFRAEFDLLKSKVGDHPALPKPRSTRQQGGGKDGRTPRQTSGQASPPSLTDPWASLRAMAEILKILKS
jgi:hypothetical protein